MTGLVSVVIPVLNGARYLRAAIESVLDQNYPHIEIIVVDNGSQDDSWAVAAAFGDPVRVVEERTPGACHARNTGVHLARGEYLAFHDADDLWVPGKLSRQVAELAADPDLDLVFSHGQNFHSPDLNEVQRLVFTCDVETQEWILPTAMLARRASFLRAGLLPALREGEFIAWYGIAQAKGLRTRIVPDVLVRRRIHLTNSTGSGRRPVDYVRAAKLILDQKRRSVG